MLNFIIKLLCKEPTSVQKFYTKYGRIYRNEMGNMYDNISDPFEKRRLISDWDPCYVFVVEELEGWVEFYYCHENGLRRFSDKNITEKVETFCKKYPVLVNDKEYNRED